MIIQETITVTGIVQGVGFRPFVYRIARENGISGTVRNDSAGVTIIAQGSSGDIERFSEALRLQAPPLSHIRTISRSGRREKKTREYDRFVIVLSEESGQPDTPISPDVGICNDCLNELFDRKNRRYCYPFINCTNCGPRYSIVKRIPYDRKYTTMSQFPLCTACEEEYADPANRRFHAQPNACSICGPQLQLIDEYGNAVSGDPVSETVNLLKNGKTVAVKGLGGFHLAVDAGNAAAVERLRQRKKREEKPFAVMVPSSQTVAAVGIFDDKALKLLSSVQRPVVIVQKRKNPAIEIAESVAPDNPCIGIMLPYTPVHFLLFYNPSSGGDYSSGKSVFDALVMTSANISEEPICSGNEEALDRLRGVADAFLIHNRNIFTRCDDSVIKHFHTGSHFFRRSRGFAPAPVFINEPFAPVLGAGAELKNTVCLIKDDKAYISQYIGDLANVLTLDYYQLAVEHFKMIYKTEPQIYAYDMHPDYLSTKYVMDYTERNERKSVKTIGIQHHHAHIASVLAEHAINGPVIGFSCDGTGLGTDGCIWGGEVFICDVVSFVRAGHLKYVPLPGGDRAAKEPWRMALSYLISNPETSAVLPEHDCFQTIGQEKCALIMQAVGKGLNTPLTSSLGRLFDAVAAITGVKAVSSYEGQAAMMLEAAAWENDSKACYPYEIESAGEPEWYNYTQTTDMSKNCKNVLHLINNKFCINFINTAGRISADVFGHAGTNLIARKFHNTVIDAFYQAAIDLRSRTGIDIVSLSGGCWQNSLLLTGITRLLSEAGFTVITNEAVPANDGGISLGQAFIAGSAFK